MNTNKRIILSIILTFMFLFVINSGFTVVDMDLIENNNEVEEPELYFKMRDSDIEKQLYTMVRNPDTKAMEPLVIGQVRINYNESELLIYIEPDEAAGWLIADLRVYVGHEPIPVAADKKPVTALFPFRQSFAKPVQSQLITIDLYDDLGLTWLPKDAEKMLQNVAVNCAVKGVGDKGQTLNLVAWAGNILPQDTDGDGDIDDEDEFEPDTTFVADLSSGTSFQVEVTDKVFRKNVSKMPETETTKAKIELLPVYVSVRRANGEAVQLEYNSYDENGALVTEIRTEAKPLVSVFAEEVAGCEFPPIYGDEPLLARDVYVAISRDEGNTWKRTNLSRSADRSSFELENGPWYPQAWSFTEAALGIVPLVNDPLTLLDNLVWNTDYLLSQHDVDFYANAWQADWKRTEDVGAIDFVDWGNPLENTDPQVGYRFPIELYLYTKLDEPMRAIKMACLEAPHSADELYGTDGTAFDSYYATVLTSQFRCEVWDMKRGTITQVNLEPAIGPSGKMNFASAIGGWIPKTAGPHRIYFYISDPLISLQNAIVNNDEHYVFDIGLMAETISTNKQDVSYVVGGAQYTWIEVNVVDPNSNGGRKKK